MMTVAQHLFQIPGRLFGDKEEILSPIYRKKLLWLPNELVEAVETKLGLLFSAEPMETNLCMAQSEEVRPDFRTNFRTTDLLDVLYALFNATRHQQHTTAPDQLSLPLPETTADFWELSQLGHQLLKLHSLDFRVPEQEQFPFLQKGADDLSNKIRFATFSTDPLEPGYGSIWINEKQFFAQVPQNAWNCQINGIAAAGHWLKNRIGLHLDPAKLEHFRKILFALTGTYRLRQKIDQLEFGHEKELSLNLPIAS